MKRACVIGGGISGLSVAYQLTKLNLEVTLFESSDHIGGQIKSEVFEGNILELGPNSTSLTPEFSKIIDELNLKTIDLSEKVRGKFIYTQKTGLIRFPSSPKDLIFTPLFSPFEKIKILSEIFIHPKNNETNLGKFLRARFGDAPVELIANAAIQGIYGCSADELEISSAAKKLLPIAQDGKSILTSVPKMRMGTKPCSIEGGLSVLIDKLRENIQIEKDKITKISPINNCYNLTPVNKDFDICIVATPSRVAADLTINFIPEIEILREIKYTNLTLSVWDLGTQKIPDGFGVLCPKSNIMGLIFYSNLYPERTNRTIVTTISKSEESLKEELDLILKSDANLIKSENYPTAIPIYGEGHSKILSTVCDIESKNQGLFFTSSWSSGVSLVSAFDRAKNIANKIIDNSTL